MTGKQHFFLELICLLMAWVAFNRVKQYHETLHFFFPYGNTFLLLDCLSLVFKDRCSQNKDGHLHPMTYCNPGAFSCKARGLLSHTLNPIVKHGGDETHSEPTLILQALIGYADLIPRIQASICIAYFGCGWAGVVHYRGSIGLLFLPARSNIRHTAKKSGYSARPV